MKINQIVMVLVINFLIAGCSSPNKLASDLIVPSDVDYTVKKLKQLYVGMKREEVESKILPMSGPLMNSNISGIGLNVYFLKPKVGVVFQFSLKKMDSLSPDDLLITVPTSANICTLRDLEKTSPK